MQKGSILNLLEGFEYESGFRYVTFMNIRKFSWIWQGSEDASGCSYGSVLNIPGFRVCWVSAYVSVLQGCEDAWIWLNNAWKFLVWLVKVSQGFKYASSSKYARAQNMARLWIWRVTQGAEYPGILLNVPW